MCLIVRCNPVLRAEYATVLRSRTISNIQYFIISVAANSNMGSAGLKGSPWCSKVSFGAPNFMNSNYPVLRIFIFGTPNNLLGTPRLFPGAPGKYLVLQIIRFRSPGPRY